jgi:hypothetical protein
VMFNFETSIFLIPAAVVATLLSSIYSIGPTEVGPVRKRFAARLPGDNPLAFRGEAGYQAEMLMPGLRFKLWLVYVVTKHPWVQVPAVQIGVVIAQVGSRFRSAPSRLSTNRSSAILPTSKASSKRADRRACSGPSCLRAHLPPFTLPHFSSSPSRRCSASPCPDGAGEVQSGDAWCVHPGRGAA